MKQFTIFILATLALMGCMSQDERAIKDYLNSKLSDRAGKVTDVEIISQDSVLSLIPMQWMYNECLREPYGADSTYFKLCEYLYNASSVRNMVLLEQKKTKELIDKFQFEWRRIVRVNIKGDDGITRDFVEVIFDNDNKTPFMIGREYDTDLKLWDLKISALPQNKSGY